MRTDNAHYVRSDSRTLSIEWDTFEKFLQDIEQLKPIHTPDNVGTGTEYYGSMRWLGCEGGGNKLMYNVINGWPELREQLAVMLKDVELLIPDVPAKAIMRRRKRARSDHGDVLDMTRVYNGQLDTAWERPKHVEHITVTTKRVTLAVDVGGYHGITNDQALWRAALALKLCDSLAKAGRVFEVWAITTSADVYREYHAPNKLYNGWCIKKTNDPVVLDRLCSMLSIGFHRICSFLACHCTEWTVDHGYGYPINAGLPNTLQERKNAGEAVIRIGQCLSMSEMLSVYNRAWNEVIKHSEESLNVA